MSTTASNPPSTIAETRESALAHGVFLAVRLTGDAPVVELCRAAARGGLRVLEITLTTPGALTAIEALAGEADLLVGGGTVLTAGQARDVARAGGRFALSPVYDPAVGDAAREHGLLYVAGAATPLEILTAHRGGSDPVKVFPAGPLGGPEFLRLVRGPLPEVRLVPTSGPTAENLHEYLAAGAVAVGVGRDVLAPPATPASVEAAARRVAEAWRRARGERP
jgi:2-dehydro-3-deoxyphosphogluconate aldolase/(4S)-4-hydroxy-2-oxoglutarate aldolase